MEQEIEKKGIIRRLFATQNRSNKIAPEQDVALSQPR
jgi:hypothetical protein